MTHLDPDHDILGKMDRRERLADVMTAAKALAGGILIGAAVYETATRLLQIARDLAFDGAVVFAIGATIWLFRRFDKQS